MTHETKTDRVETARKALLARISSLRDEAAELREQALVCENHAAKLYNAAQTGRWWECAGTLDKETIEDFCQASPVGLLDGDDDDEEVTS